MKILLLNGHGGDPWDCGATGCGYEEADLTREFADIIETYLKKYVTVCRYPKKRDAYKDVEKGAFAKTLKDNFGTVSFDYAFEVHFNAFNGQGHGTECYVTDREDGITVEQAIMKRMGKYFTLRDNDSIFDGVKRTNFLVINTLKNMGISGALLETCFIDNSLDMKVWQSNKNVIASDIVDGIVEGFGLKASTGSKPKPTPAPTPTPSTSFKVGDKVGVKAGAKDYNNSAAGGVKRDTVCYTVDELKGDRAVLDIAGICTAFHTKDLFKSTSTTTSKIKVGDFVGVKVGACDYNGNPAKGVVRGGKLKYSVDELKGDRAVLDIPGICTAFHIKDLFK